QNVDRNIFSADWSADGRLTVARVVAGEQQIEFPIGKVLYRSSGWLANVRISPRNDAIAFIEHPVRHDDAASVKVVDLAGNTRTVSGGWASAAGLAWRNNAEVWFTATRDGSPQALWAVTTSGKVRTVGQAPGFLILRDIAANGAVLVTL